MPQTDELLVRAVKGLGLGKMARRVLPYAPKWVQRMNEKREIRYRRRLVIEDELRGKYEQALRLLQANGSRIGDYLEFGVYNGTSLSCMHKVLDQLGLDDVRLFGFDSFEGLPPLASSDCNGHWRPGEFKCSYEFARAVLDEEGVDWNRVQLIKGMFSESLTEDVKTKFEIEKASVIMVDCDLYQSTVEALAFCDSLIGDECVIFFDDWFPLADKNMGEKPAFDEYLASRPDLRSRELFDFKPWGKVFHVIRSSS